MTIWDNEKLTERVAEMFSNGTSAGEIKDRLNLPVSRNAIIGRMWRMGVRGRAANKEPGNRARPGPKPTPKTSHCGATLSRAARVRARQEYAPAPVDPPETAVDFQGLEKHHCRWPYGDPGTGSLVYCGQHRDGKSSYCPAHNRRQFVER